MRSENSHLRPCAGFELPVCRTYSYLGNTCEVRALDLWGSGSFSLFVLKKRRLIDYIRETNQKTPRNLKGIRNGRQINRYLYEWALRHFLASYYHI